MLRLAAEVGRIVQVTDGSSSALVWASLITAGGTLVLALATFSMARRTADAAEASTALVALERDQLRQAYLPIVVPVIESLSVSHVADVSEGIAHRTGEVHVTIPIVNIGVGPAVGVEVDIHWLDQVGGESVAPQPMKIPSKLGGLAPGASWEMNARFRGLATPVLPFLLSLAFGDTAGALYLVEGRYFPGESLFRDLTIRELDSASRSGTPARPI
jgi:hypothetical protein